MLTFKFSEYSGLLKSNKSDSARWGGSAPTEKPGVGVLGD